MLPLSGRREAASKSNSSTLEPSSTTTRVSSGWLASISMRFDMEFSGRSLCRLIDTQSVGAKAARLVLGNSTATRRNGAQRRDRSGGQYSENSHNLLPAVWQSGQTVDPPDR